jgi:glycine dehydrogenase
VSFAGGEGALTKKKKRGAVSSAPFGSAMILPIPWMYTRMLGFSGLRKATQV